MSRPQPYWQPEIAGNGLQFATTKLATKERGLPRTAVPTGQERTMTHNALALFVGAAMFRGRMAIRENEQGAQEFESGMRRAGRGLRRPSPSDPEMVENDYYRFLNAPRD